MAKLLWLVSMVSRTLISHSELKQPATCLSSNTESIHNVNYCSKSRLGQPPLIYLRVLGLEQTCNMSHSYNHIRNPLMWIQWSFHFDTLSLSDEDPTTFSSIMTPLIVLPWCLIDWSFLGIVFWCFFRRSLVHRYPSTCLVSNPDVCSA